MAVTTFSSAVHITPVVVKTLLQHAKKKGKKYVKEDQKEEATDDIFFDEAFHIVKRFIELGTENTVESLQAFTNTHVPAPPWAAISPVLIPLLSCNHAADVLINWFGPTDLKDVVGGERWWQVRGMDGLDGEWITEKEYLSDIQLPSDEKLSDDERDILRMEELESVMLYVHGGGYFWGSINTHRYQIIHYARKFKGRAFAVNYRKAPQYPWPCPLQDVLAAYLYLIQPPPGALHKPVSPSKIVLAGDSAGGGLCLTTLTIIRDMGLPAPAGAVLISPWVDLTHSFPSVMINTKTDIIPPHGFLAKPSALWPIELLPPKGTSRVMPADRNTPPKPGHADTLKPGKGRLQEEEERVTEGKPAIGEDKNVDSQVEMLTISHGAIPEVDQDQNAGRRVESSQVPDRSDLDFWQPRPPKVLMDDPHAVPLELRSQIQLYATTEQLTHPLVSPVLQGSLGNLPPLYIIGGEDEALRDEIIYVAHRAAHPDKYPVREGVLKSARRQQENAEKFTKPTKVHLQVFDGMCHVLTVFMFTESAKYAYHSIAEFVKHVTQNSPDHLEQHPFPTPSPVETDGDSHRGETKKTSKFKAMMNSIRKKTPAPSEPAMPSKSEKVSGQSDAELHAESMQEIVGENDTTQMKEPSKREIKGDAKMIRHRVDIHGKFRIMEPEHDISALQIPPCEIGIIKEVPCKRWASGQEEWDKRYKRYAENAIRQRRRNEAKATKMLENARDQGLLLVHESSSTSKNESVVPTSASSKFGVVQQDRRWGPLDLEDERPPPSSISKRRDTPEALALLKKSVYHTAPATHVIVPKMKTIDTVKAALDPHDHPIKAPRQSASEQQVRTHVMPMHGLNIWDALLRYFIQETSKKST